MSWAGIRYLAGSYNKTFKPLDTLTFSQYLVKLDRTTCFPFHAWDEDNLLQMHAHHLNLSNLVPCHHNNLNFCIQTISGGSPESSVKSPCDNEAGEADDNRIGLRSCMYFVLPSVEPLCDFVLFPGDCCCGEEQSGDIRC